MIKYAQGFYHFIMCFSILVCGALLTFLPYTGPYMHAVGTGLMWMVGLSWFMPGQAKTMIQTVQSEVAQSIQSAVQTEVSTVAQQIIQEVKAEK